MSPSFLVKILCYRCRPFANKLASSAYICAGCCLILKSLQDTQVFRQLQDQTATSRDIC